jgi:hypothetical protein
MPIDPSIALGVKAPQFESPLNALAQVLQVQQAQNQNALAQYTISRARREDSDADTLNQLYQGAVKPDGTIDRSALFSGAAQRGLGAKIPGLQKGLLDADEAQGKVAKQKVDLVDAKLKQSRAYLDNVRTAEQYLAWHEANHRDPILGAELSARGVTAEQSRARILEELQRPGGLERLVQQSALGMEKFTELNKPTTNVVNAGGTSQVMQTPGLGGAPQLVGTVQHTATPGEVMSDQRSRAQLAQSDRHHRETLAQGKAQIVETDNGPLLVDKGANRSQAINGPDGKPLPPKDKPLNDGQSKANLFGTRMQEADRILTEQAAAGVKRPGVIKGVAESVGNVAGLGTESMGGALSDAAGSLTNWTQSDGQQQVEQAQRDFINATLRRESGASISPAEFRNANKQYFPQPNDSDAVLAQKARNRKIATEGVLAEVPEAKRSKPAAPAAPAAPALPTGWTVKAH